MILLSRIKKIVWSFSSGTTERNRQTELIFSDVEHHTDDCIPNWAIMIMIHLQYLHEMAVMEATAKTPSYQLSVSA